MLIKMIKERGIPDFPKVTAGDTRLRKELTDGILSEEYGFLPPKPFKQTYQVLETDERFCAGKAVLSKVLITVCLNNKEFSFPVYSVVPANGKKNPFFIHINFSDGVPDKYLPSEEIIDNGFAVLSFCYKDVSSDDGDFTSGLSGIVYDNGERADTACGKIGLWSWAASRVMDFAMTIDGLDTERATVVGHSRLGKTALLTGVLDERFSCVISNNSGCSGAALSRGKEGETVEKIYNRFPYWFCKNYSKYVDNEAELPFDQHFLPGLIAPRKVYVASAEKDLWADPVSEFLSCVAANDAYKHYNVKGFVCPDRLPVCGDAFHEGNIGYHMRSGLHYLSREDWNYFMCFLKNIDKGKYW